MQIIAPDGERIGMIRLPENCANVCFGGAKRNRLFMAASQSLYAVYVERKARVSHNRRRYHFEDATPREAQAAVSSAGSIAIGSS